MKTKQIHVVRTSGLIGLLGLLGFTGLIVFWPWGVNTQKLEVNVAKHKAEVIAYQIIQIYKEATLNQEENSPSVQTRGIASVKEKGPLAGGVLTEFKNQGSMGIDPWGRPYQYRIVEANPGDLQLVVWSLGPNGVLDQVELAGLQSEEPLKAAPLSDDIHVVLSVPR